MNKINQIFYSAGFGIQPILTEKKLTLAAWIKMTDCEMYDGHNDFAVTNSQMIRFAVEKLTDVAEIIDQAN